jgi:hypothetical protein
MVIAVDEGQVARRLQDHAGERVARGKIGGELHGVFAHRRLGRAQAVVERIAPGGAHREVRMGIAEASVVQQHGPAVDREVAAGRELGQHILLLYDLRDLRLDAAIARARVEIDRAVLGEDDLAVFRPRADELAGMISGRERDAADAVRARLGDRAVAAGAGEVPGVGVKTGRWHPQPVLGHEPRPRIKSRR